MSRYYVDKSLLIRDLIECSAKHTIITRPRRSGKTQDALLASTFLEANFNDQGKEIKPKCFEKFRDLKVVKEDKVDVECIVYLLKNFSQKENENKKEWEQGLLSFLNARNYFSSGGSLQKLDNTLKEKVKKLYEIAKQLLLDEEFEELNQKSCKEIEDIIIVQVDALKKQQNALFPVIFMTFTSEGGDIIELKKDISRMYKRHLFLIYFLQDKAKEDDYFQSKLNKFNAFLYCESDCISDSIYFLSEVLFEATGKKSFVFIDEFAQPLISSYETNLFEENETIIRDIFRVGIQENPNVIRSIYIGVITVSKEIIFSGFNSLIELSVLNNVMSDKFGLTETEVVELIEKHKNNNPFLTNQLTLKELQMQFSSYNFGNTPICNIWSVMNSILQTEASQTKVISSFWNLSGNPKLIIDSYNSLKEQDLKEVNTFLFEEGIIEFQPTNDLNFNLLKSGGSQNFLNLLLHSGYTTPLSELEMKNLNLIEPNEMKKYFRLPNYEIKQVFQEQLLPIFTVKKMGVTLSISDTVLISDNIDKKGFQNLLNEILFSKKWETFNLYFQSLIFSIVKISNQFFSPFFQKKFIANRKLNSTIFLPTQNEEKLGILHQYKIVSTKEEITDENQKDFCSEQIEEALWQILENQQTQVLLDCQNLESFLIRAMVFYKKNNIQQVEVEEFVINRQMLQQIWDIVSANQKMNIEKLLSDSKKEERENYRNNFLKYHNTNKIRDFWRSGCTQQQRSFIAKYNFTTKSLRGVRCESWIMKETNFKQASFQQKLFLPQQFPIFSLFNNKIDLIVKASLKIVKKIV